jgi:hypothetical protein
LCQEGGRGGGTAAAVLTLQQVSHFFLGFLGFRVIFIIY